MIKNHLNSTLKLLLALSVPLLLTQSCSKEQENASKPEIENTSMSEAKKKEIAELTTFLHELTDLDKKKIVYDEQTDAFYYMDVQQITRERLLKIKNKTQQ